METFEQLEHYAMRLRANGWLSPKQLQQVLRDGAETCRLQNRPERPQDPCWLYYLNEKNERVTVAFPDQASASVKATELHQLGYEGGNFNPDELQPKQFTTKAQPWKSEQ